MMETRKPQHYKTRNEDTPSRIWIDFAILTLYFVVFLFVCIKRHADITEELSGLISINPFSGLILFTLLHIVFLVVKSLVYNIRKRIIIAKGNVIEGKIIGTNNVKVILTRGPGPIYDFQYCVQLSDGRTVQTEVYYYDFVKKDCINKCTVYEYNNHYYFTDYQ